MVNGCARLALTAALAMVIGLAMASAETCKVEGMGENLTTNRACLSECESCADKGGLWCPVAEGKKGKQCVDSDAVIGPKAKLLQCRHAGDWSKILPKFLEANKGYLSTKEQCGVWFVQHADTSSVAVEHYAMADPKLSTLLSPVGTMRNALAEVGRDASANFHCNQLPKHISLGLRAESIRAEYDEDFKEAHDYIEDMCGKLLEVQAAIPDECPSVKFPWCEEVKRDSEKAWAEVYANIDSVVQNLEDLFTSQVAAQNSVAEDDAEEAVPAISSPLGDEDDSLDALDVAGDKEMEKPTGRSKVDDEAIGGVPVVKEPEVEALVPASRPDEEEAKPAVMKVDDDKDAEVEPEVVGNKSDVEADAKRDGLPVGQVGAVIGDAVDGGDEASGDNGAKTKKAEESKGAKGKVDGTTGADTGVVTGDVDAATGKAPREVLSPIGKRHVEKLTPIKPIDTVLSDEQIRSMDLDLLQLSEESTNENGGEDVETVGQCGLHQGKAVGLARAINEGLRFLKEQRSPNGKYTNFLALGKKALTNLSNARHNAIALGETMKMWGSADAEVVVPLFEDEADICV